MIQKCDHSIGRLVVRAGIVDLAGDDRAIIYGALLWMADKLSAVGSVRRAADADSIVGAADVPLRKLQLEDDAAESRITKSVRKAGGIKDPSGTRCDHGVTFAISSSNVINITP